MWNINRISQDFGHISLTMISFIWFNCIEKKINFFEKDDLTEHSRNYLRPVWYGIRISSKMLTCYHECQLVQVQPRWRFLVKNVPLIPLIPEEEFFKQRLIHYAIIEWNEIRALIWIWIRCLKGVTLWAAYYHLARPNIMGSRIIFCLLTFS